VQSRVLLDNGVAVFDVGSSQRVDLHVVAETAQLDYSQL
jgi:hypothetical protein